jgi:cytochrome P450
MTTTDPWTTTGATASKDTDDPTAEFGAKYNPFDPGFINDPGQVYQQLHSEAPVCWSDAFQSYVVTRYDDVVNIVDNPKFTSEGKDGPEPPAEVMEELAKGFMLEHMLYSTDPPVHTRLRTLIQSAMPARLLPVLEAKIREKANSVIDTFAADGKVDLYPQYVHPVTDTAILDYIGVPREDQAEVMGWHKTWESLFIPGAEPDELRNSTRNVVGYQHYLHDLVQKRRTDPRDDVATGFARASSERIDDYEPLSEGEVVWGLIEVIGAAGNTTYGMANVLFRLLQNQDNWNALLTDRGLLDGAVEEGLRVESPVLGCARETTTEVELGGVKLPAGAPVLISFAAANLDQQAFAEAGEFDLARKNAARQVTLGRGGHYCIGARVGRLMIKTAADVLLDRLPTARFVEGYVPEFYAPFPFLRCVASLPVQWNGS